MAGQVFLLVLMSAALASLVSIKKPHRKIEAIEPWDDFNSDEMWKSTLEKPPIHKTKLTVERPEGLTDYQWQQQQSVFYKRYKGVYDVDKVDAPLSTTPSTTTRFTTTARFCHSWPNKPIRDKFIPARDFWEILYDSIRSGGDTERWRYNFDIDEREYLEYLKNAYNHDACFATCCEYCDNFISTTAAAIPSTIVKLPDWSDEDYKRYLELYTLPESLAVLQERRKMLREYVLYYESLHRATTTTTTTETVPRYRLLLPFASNVTTSTVGPLSELEIRAQQAIGTVNDFVAFLDTKFARNSALRKIKLLFKGAEGGDCLNECVNHCMNVDPSHTPDYF